MTTRTSILRIWKKTMPMGIFVTRTSTWKMTTPLMMMATKRKRRIKLENAVYRSILIFLFRMLLAWLNSCQEKMALKAAFDTEHDMDKNADKQDEPLEDGDWYSTVKAGMAAQVAKNTTEFADEDVHGRLLHEGWRRACNNDSWSFLTCRKVSASVSTSA